jgi:hypothetical protein
VEASDSPASLGAVFDFWPHAVDNSRGEKIQGAREPERIIGGKTWPPWQRRRKGEDD